MHTLQQLIPLAVAPMLYPLAQGAVGKYKRWKAARTNAPYYRNWRGAYVQDLWLRRAERLFWLSVIAFFVVGFVLSYSWLTID
jgi:hypothetical protein